MNAAMWMAVVALPSRATEMGTIAGASRNTPTTSTTVMRGVGCAIPMGIGVTTSIFLKDERERLTRNWTD